MPGTRRGIYIEFVGDEIKYVRSAENVLKTNTKLDASFKKVGVDARLSADVQVAAAVKANQALRANAINLRAVAASSSGEKRAAATRLAEQAEAQLALAYGATTRAQKELSTETKKGERDLNKLARGALAGSGLFEAFGRALAFASTGFIAFAAASTVIRKSFDAATELLATQRAVDQQLKTQGATWERYGKQINETDLKLSHVSGFTNQELLQSFEYLDRVTGKVGIALKLNGVAADVARGRNIKLASAALALGKAYGGSITALRRLGIVIPKALKGQEALNYVAQKFAGQAAANATVAEKFNATLVDTEEIIGTALLPTINRYLTELGDWLAKMNETGRLQKDATAAVDAFVTVMHDAQKVIETVDKVTGSFKNTLKLIVAIRLASILTNWIGLLGRLATSWTAVETQATLAAQAEGRALGGGFGGYGGGGAGGGGPGPGPVPPGGGGGYLPFVIGGAGAGAARFFGRTPGLSKSGQRVSDYLKAGERNEKAVAKAASTAEKSAGVWERAGADLSRVAAAGERFGGFARGLATGAGGLFGTTSDTSGKPYVGPDGYIYYPQLGGAPDRKGKFVGIPGQSVISPQLRNFPRTGTTIPRALTPGNAGSPFTSPVFTPFPGTGAGAGDPFARLKPLSVWKNFQISTYQQIQQAQAALTKSMTDDVIVAKNIIARIKRLIAAGHLQGPSLAAALQAEAGALSTIWSAEDAAIQRRKDAAEKAAQAIDAAIDPAKLELRLARDTALGRSIIPDLRALRDAAQKVIDSGKGTLEQQTTAYNQVVSLNQQIKDAIANQGPKYEESLKLRLALAKEEAFGLPTGGTLAKLRAAAIKAAKSGKFHGQNLIDLYGLIAGYNSEIDTSATAALGLFRTFDKKKLDKLGLNREQRKKIGAMLSQLGPKGTVPGSGVGAAGYAINAKTGQPIVVHTNVHLDKRVVARSTTVVQQQQRRRNPPQRRGPNAGAKAA